MNIDIDLSCTMVIFGGTGDLTHRKLLPAIYNLEYEGSLPENFAVVAIGRREKTTEEYRKEIYDSIKKFSRFDIDEDVWDIVKDKIYYRSMDFTQDVNYGTLDEYLEEIAKKHNTKGNRIYYLAVAPEFFSIIVDKLNKSCMYRKENSWQRVVIEKPFGSDLDSARHLNDRIVNVFKEENTYRIDHYLGKEMIQNIMVIRFANMIFEPLWNNRFIDHIQITSAETVGVENRGNYYEKSGAIRDMVQSHLLQLLSLVTMEPPNHLDTNSIRDEKVKVIKALKTFSSEDIKLNVVRGQYGEGIQEDIEMIGYRHEPRVSKHSNTETFVALRLFIDNFRWEGVPFYIRTGKRMPKKTTEIVVQFKSMKSTLYFKDRDLEPNMLVIRIQPKEGIFFQFNAKEPGTHMGIAPVQMDFCQNCQIGINSPEAYERLIYDVMKGDSTLFARWDEVESSWEFVNTILEEWEDENPNFPNYEAGTWGPKKANDLVESDNRKWIIP